MSCATRCDHHANLSSCLQNIKFRSTFGIGKYWRAQISTRETTGSGDCSLMAQWLFMPWFQLNILAKVPSLLSSIWLWSFFWDLKILGKKYVASANYMKAKHFTYKFIKSKSFPTREKTKQTQHFHSARPQSTSTNCTLSTNQKSLLTKPFEPNHMASTP